MRRLIQHDRDDQGVGTFFLVLAIVPILIGAALAIDVTRFSQENSSAQHSADATAMAVATDCVLSPTRKPQPAATYNLYRKTPEQVISSATPINDSSCSTPTVTITVEKDLNGLMLNRADRLVHKSAEVTFGSLLSATTTIPLAIASCEFDLARLNSDSNITLFLSDPSPHTGCSSLSGGFSELELSSTDTANDPSTAIDEALCTVQPDASGELPGDTGHDLKKYIECINPTGDPAPLNVPALVPIYNSDDCTKADGCKGDGPYPVKGYAMFVIKGYVLQTKNLPTGVSCGKDDCLYGDFVRFVLPAELEDVVLGGPDNYFGAQQIFLSK